MPHYVDGFVVPVPKENIEAYRAMAEKAAAIWKEYGALDYRECLADDLFPKDVYSFSDLAQLKEGETVIFAWITYESREHRDAVNAKVMADPRLCNGMDMDKMPFDCKRMAYGGFKTLVEI